MALQIKNQCDCCESSGGTSESEVRYCMWTYQVTYDCVAGTWGTVSAVSSQCVSACTEVPWYLKSQTSVLCLYELITCGDGSLGCQAGEDCEGGGGLKTPPEFPIDCDCETSISVPPSDSPEPPPSDIPSEEQECNCYTTLNYDAIFDQWSKSSLDKLTWSCRVRTKAEALNVWIYDGDNSSSGICYWHRWSDECVDVSSSEPLEAGWYCCKVWSYVPGYTDPTAGDLVGLDTFCIYFTEGEDPCFCSMFNPGTGLCMIHTVREIISGPYATHTLCQDDDCMF